LCHDRISKFRLSSKGREIKQKWFPPPNKWEKKENSSLSQLLLEAARTKNPSVDLLVATPPRGELRGAIDAGLRDIGIAVKKLDGADETLWMVGIEKGISVAISHGVGIYNHSPQGRIGCAQIYHHAALGLVDVLGN
jgi:hypothetical protein